MQLIAQPTPLPRKTSPGVGGMPQRQSSDSFGRELADILDRNVRKLIVEPVEGYPNLQVRGGVSVLMAEYASIKTELGQMGGYVIAGGIGRSIFDEQEHGKSWYVAVGYYAGYEVFDFTFNTALISSHIINSLGLAFELEFSYYFEDFPRLGVYADLQFGVSIDTESFLLNAGAGIAWKLFSK